MTILEKNEIKNITISKLQVNNMVLVADDNGKARFSKVVNFFHRIEDINADFINLYFKNDLNELKNDNKITLTPRHLIFAKNQNDMEFNYKAAMNVEIGAQLSFFDSYNNQFKNVFVEKIEKVNLEKSGIYSPLTEYGTLVVSNIHVSCYSMVKNHKLAQFVFDLLNKLGNFFLITSDSYSLYSKILFEFLNFTKMNSYFLN